MATINKDELKKRVLERLEDGDNPDDIILDICNSADMNWNEGKKFVETVQAENENEITLAQSPLLVLIALAIFLGGLGLLGVTVYDITTAYNHYASAKNAASSGFLLYLFAYGGYFWEYGLVGTAMIIGSLRGMQDVWTAIFEKWGILTR